MEALSEFENFHDCTLLKQGYSLLKTPNQKQIGLIKPSTITLGCYSGMGKGSNEDLG